MSRQPNSQVASAQPSRPKRVPVGQRSRVSVKNRDDNYHYRVVNANMETDPDRVQAFLDAGYEIVPADKAGQIGDKQVDTPSGLGSSSQISVGQGTKAVLMRIRKEWYSEDQTVKQAEIDALESTMKKESKADYGNIEYKK